MAAAREIPPAAPRQAGAARWLAGIALVAGTLAVGWALLGGGHGQVLHARFLNAGRLVRGGDVRIAGRKVGTIAAVTLTSDNVADVKLSITDSAVLPMRQGTRAAIRSVGAATLTNNFVELTPGWRGNPALADGATLSLTQTSGLVDLDAILSSFDAPARHDIRATVGSMADVFAGSGAARFNAMLTKLSPGLAQLSAVSADLAADQARLTRLLSTAATTATAVASRRRDLTDAVWNTARTMRSLAAERGALADVLARAPAALRQGRRTLADLATMATTLRPALHELGPTAKPLGDVLARLHATLPAATATVDALRPQLPQLRTALLGFPGLTLPASQALGTTARTLTAARPVLRGLRIYGADFLLGILNGLITLASGTYNKSGHYAHIAFVQPPERALGGPLTGVDPLLSIPGLFKLRTGIRARCPGADAPPAPDSSSPWNVPGLCDPRDGIPAAVNSP